MLRDRLTQRRCLDMPITHGPQKEEDVVEKLLTSIGISYKHRNDVLLQANQIEKERVKKIVEVGKISES